MPAHLIEPLTTPRLLALLYHTSLLHMYYITPFQEIGQPIGSPESVLDIHHVFVAHGTDVPRCTPQPGRSDERLVTTALHFIVIHPRLTVIFGSGHEITELPICEEFT